MHFINFEISLFRKNLFRKATKITKNVAKMRKNEFFFYSAGFYTNFQVAGKDIILLFVYELSNFSSFNQPCKDSRLHPSTHLPCCWVLSILSKLAISSTFWCNITCLNLRSCINLGSRCWQGLFEPLPTSRPQFFIYCWDGRQIYRQSSCKI